MSEEETENVVEDSEEGVERTEKRKSGYLPLVILVIFFLFGFLLFKERFTNEVHYHAGFQVYTDGQLQDFSDIKYMTLGYCGEDTQVDKQLEKAHLHDNVGDVVHVHRKGGVWRDLFINIGYEFDTTKSVKAFVNGSSVENILDYPINPLDSVVILLGDYDTSRDYAAGAVSRERILEVEQKSESCGS